MAGSQSITIFDGHESIGGTKILLQSKETRLLLDFGTNYKRTGQLYEQFLQPRASRGITDWIAVGLLPRIRGIYRRDLFPTDDFPDLDRAWPGERPSAVLVTHGHLDHAGGLAFLDPTIPTVCTPMTLALLRAWQEVGTTSPQSEVTYTGPRRNDSEGRLVIADRKSPKVGRSFALLEEAPSTFVDALARSPYGENTAYEAPPPTRAPGHWLLSLIHI